MTLPLFAGLGTRHPKFRGSAYRAVHADLRLQFNKDEVLKMKGKRRRKQDRVQRYRQTGGN